MKNALEIYIEALPSMVYKTWRLPKNAASDATLLPLWISLTKDIAEEITRRQYMAFSEVILSASPKARKAMLADDDNDLFGPIKEVLLKAQSKTIVPSVLRSAEWEMMPVQIREASQFSAGIASARVMAAIQSRLQANSDWDFTQPKGREAFIRDMREVMIAEGVGTTVSGEGSLMNPQANSRLGLIYDQQTNSARGYAARKIGMDPDVLAAAPAQELIREAEPKGGPSARRPWKRIWTENGGRLYDGRMIALKTDPIWTSISRFGTPWPPFDYGSHMGVRDILRDEAIALGIMDESDVQTPDPVPDYNAVQRADVKDIPQGMMSWITKAFGDRISISDGVATLKPKGA